VGGAPALESIHPGLQRRIEGNRGAFEVRTVFGGQGNWLFRTCNILQVHPGDSAGRLLTQNWIFSMGEYECRRRECEVVKTVNAQVFKSPNEPGRIPGIAVVQDVPRTGRKGKSFGERRARKDGIVWGPPLPGYTGDNT